VARRRDAAAAPRAQAAHLAESLALVAALAEALAEAHARGVVHRDLKPSNVFLPGGDPRAAKLLDFGIAHLARGTRAPTRTGMMLGTPGYMAPEQARGDRGVDARADVFALGTILFECVAGRPAFLGEHPMALLAKILIEEPPRLRAVRPDAPRAVEALVARMLAKDPAGRPADATAVLAELAALGPLEGSDATPEPARDSSLTRGEQRLLTVVLAGRALRPETNPTLDGAAGPAVHDARPTELIAPRSRRDARMGCGRRSSIRRATTTCWWRCARRRSRSAGGSRCSPRDRWCGRWRGRAWRRTRRGRRRAARWRCGRCCPRRRWRSPPGAPSSTRRARRAR
jgi:serine/threonine protein kinase